MNVRRGGSRLIVAIATLVLVASAAWKPTKSREPRRWLTAISDRSKPTIVRAQDEKPAPGCTGDTCRNTYVTSDRRRPKLSDLVPSEHYLVYPKKYERLVSRKNLGTRYTNKHKRHVLETAASNSTASEASRKDTDDKDTLVRVPLHRSRGPRFRTLSSKGARKRRNLADDDSSAQRGTRTSSKSNPSAKVNEISGDKAAPRKVPLYKSHGPLRAHLASSGRRRRSLVAGDDHGDSVPRSAKVSAKNGPPAKRNEVSQNNDKVALRKARPYRSVVRGLDGIYLVPLERPRRGLVAGNNYIARRNASDYYAERRAVMARFYARQREIEARYGNLTISTSKPDRATPRSEPDNVISLRFYPDKNFTDNGVDFRHPSKTIDPVYSGNPPAKPDESTAAWNNSNVERQAWPFYFTTPVPCDNASLSGTFAPKRRFKHPDNTTESDEDDDTPTIVGWVGKNGNGSGHDAWEPCKGKVVYQHNLLLGLRGPSTLNTVFEVIIQGPVCITCVEALRYNETKATVAFESGGRGHDYVRLKLQGYENEGFSYIIKVWAVKKLGPDCDNVDY